MNTAKFGYGKVVLPSSLEVEVSASRLDIVRFLMICMVLLTIVSIFHVWSRFRLVELNLQISEAVREMKELEQQQKRLKLEAASLRTSARIETIAKRDLGMTVPQEQQVVVVK
ncbi:MAG: cell division protein FtsL [Trichlorobacter sp.]|jgi:cell division protein FtsL